jgi:hypothetical protein
LSPEGQLKPADATTDDHLRRDEEGSALFSEDSVTDADLSFAAFILKHAGCGVSVEIRLTEGLLLEWCPTCAALETFGALGKQTLDEPWAGVRSRAR